MEVGLGIAAALGVPTVGDEPATFPAGFGIGNKIYKDAGLDRQADIMSAVGMVSAGVRDYINGDFYFSYNEGPGLVLSPDLQISIATTFIGAVVPSGTVDALLDATTLDDAMLNAVPFIPEIKSYVPTRRVGIYIPSLDTTKP